MSNSPLVSYTKLSPNHSGPRTHAIDRITPHCVVGQCTVESLGDVFAQASRNASSNYGIGTDGRVGLYVNEANRSWCSSSADNDQRAVTIECASDTTEPYAFNAACYQTLINLCTDICKRNGKNVLLWLGDKGTSLNYNPQPNEMVLTVHRWFAATACPGTWMMDHMADLAYKVTAALGGKTPQPTPAPVDPEKQIWDSLSALIGNDYGVAGLMGNLYAESGLRSNNLQNSFERTLGLTDEQYTAAVDNGGYPNFVQDKAGYGLAQWTFWSRKQNLLTFKQSAGTSIGDLTMQLNFLAKELQESYKSTLDCLKNAKSVRYASDVVLTQFEKPADQSEAMKQKRAAYGQVYYDKYASSTPSPAPAPTPAPTPGPTVPYMVRIAVEELNVRSGPGTNYPIVRTVSQPSVYTIVEVNGYWGKLKSGAGWINLQYTTVYVKEG